MDPRKQAAIRALQAMSNPQRPYSSPYQTALAPDEERAFQQWIAQNNVPNRDGLTADYDMRGFYQAAQNGDPRAKTEISPIDHQMHFTDTFKTPLHKSFSADSQYAGPTAPHWDGNALRSPSNEAVFLELPEDEEK